MGNEEFNLNLQNDDTEDFVVEFGEVTETGGAGTSDFNQLTNRPKYDSQTMTGNTNIPKVSTKTSELTNDADFQTWSEVEGAINTAIGGLNIPTKTSDLTNDGSDGTSSYVESDNLAKVATSGKYTDLTDTPVIPTVNDATLTITQNGTSKGTFTSNDADDKTIEVSDTTYSNFTGTDGTAAGTSGLVPAPATTDAGKFLKADGTWDTAGGGGGDTVYSTKTTSNSATGGAVYIGNLGTDQTEVQDPSPNDNHYKYFWALPWSNNGASYGQPGNGSVNILGSAKGANTVAIGSAAGSTSYGATSAVMVGNSANAGPSGVSIGDGAGTTQDYTGNVCIGAAAVINTYGTKNSISLGRFSMATRTGELNIGTGTNTTAGFNSTNYRVIGGVHDGQDAHDAVTVGQVNSVIDAINTALNTSIPHIGASN